MPRFSIKHRKSDPKYKDFKYSGIKFTFTYYMIEQFEKLYLPKGICSPITDYVGSFFDILIYYSLDSNQFICSKGWNNRLISLLSNDRCKLIFTPLYVIFPGNLPHLSVLVIDKNNKTIQRFDPHGIFEESLIKNMEVMDEKIREYFIVPGIIDSYISPRDYCIIGPQQSQELENEALKYGKGYCTMWTFWYLEKRLEYPELSLEELEKKIERQFQYWKKKGVSKSKIIYNYAIHHIKKFEEDKGKKYSEVS